MSLNPALFMEARDRDPASELLLILMEFLRSKRSFFLVLALEHQQRQTRRMSRAMATTATSEYTTSRESSATLPGNAVSFTCSSISQSAGSMKSQLTLFTVPSTNTLQSALSRSLIHTMS